MKNDDINNLKNKGFVVLRDYVPTEWVNKIKNELDLIFINHREKQITNSNEINTEGVALHILLDSEIFFEFLNFLIKKGLVEDLKKHFFNSNCILNSFSGINNLPKKTNFSANIHRDLRFYSQGLPVMVNCLLMVDDFTKENGATHLLPYSHKKEEKPTDEYFFKNSVQILGNSGDLLIFDSNVFHASGKNKTDKGRRGIPITISRSFLKQLFDYPRAIGYDKINNFDYPLQQFLGYHSRVPSSLDEWYQPEEKRFYKKNQD